MTVDDLVLSFLYTYVVFWANEQKSSQLRHVQVLIAIWYICNVNVCKNWNVVMSIISVYFRLLLRFFKADVCNYN